MKGAVRFAALAAVLVFGGAWVAALVWPGAEMARTLWSSAVVAFAVQLVAFAVARRWVERNPIAGWGLGSVVRFVAVAVHALVGVPALGVAQAPALVSLVAFLFVTMLVEPLFLRT